MKRSLDLAIVIAAAPFVVPIVALCCIVIRLTSPGPAIFRQTRIGLHEEQFTCLKLRTMYASTEDAPSHEIASSAVTPIGRWLRMLKVDELPQFWNILRGEMSFVGPRPCLPTQTEVIEARRALNIYSVLPGVTGAAQIMGIDMTDPARLASSDAKYIATRSIATDIKILAATFLGAGRGDRVRY